MNDLSDKFEIWNDCTKEDLLPALQEEFSWTLSWVRTGLSKFDACCCPLLLNGCELVLYMRRLWANPVTLWLFFSPGWDQLSSKWTASIIGKYCRHCARSMAYLQIRLMRTWPKPSVPCSVWGTSSDRCSEFYRPILTLTVESELLLFRLFCADTQKNWAEFYPRSEGGKHQSGVWVWTSPWVLCWNHDPWEDSSRSYQRMSA